MTWQQKPGTAARKYPQATSAEMSDPHRPFTEATWQMIVIMMTEDRKQPWQIARALSRDTRVVAEKIREAQASGLLDKVEHDLLEHNGLHALKVRRMLREAVAI